MSNGIPLPGIEHIVVVMFENRSFDNVLGGLYPELARQGKYFGLTGTECNPLDPADPDSVEVCVWQAEPGLNAMIMPYPDPGEAFFDMNEQIFGATAAQPIPPAPPMNGFVWNYLQQPPSSDGVKPVARNIMQYYAPSLLPVTSLLAQTYAVSDLWFACGPVQTLVNRVFTHCATPSKKDPTHARIDNTDFPVSISPPFDPPVQAKSVFQLLDEANPSLAAGVDADGLVNWKVYYSAFPQCLSALVDYVYQHWDYDSFWDGNVYQYESDVFPDFASDVRNGTLPKYSFIEPRYASLSAEPLLFAPPNSYHPGGAVIDVDDPNGPALPPPISVCYGEQFLQSIYMTLCQNQELFTKTLLIVTYDEHGGLFDHFPTPPAVSPFQPGEVVNFNYNRYGVRVPALLINPLLPAGTIFRPQPQGGGGANPFDHTTIIRTLREQFSLGDPLTPRDASAPSLAGLMDRLRDQPLFLDLQSPQCESPGTPGTQTRGSHSLGPALAGLHRSHPDRLSLRSRS